MQAESPIYINCHKCRRGSPLELFDRNRGVCQYCNTPNVLPGLMSRHNIPSYTLELRNQPDGYGKVDKVA